MRRRLDTFLVQLRQIIQQLGNSICCLIQRARAETCHGAFVIPALGELQHLFAFCQIARLRRIEIIKQSPFLAAGYKFLVSLFSLDYLIQ